MNDLEQMMESTVQQYKDHLELDNLEFLLKYEFNFKDNILKDYKVYLSDNEGEELLDYDEWIEEYKEEVGDELQERMTEYFTEYGIDKYEGEYYNIYDILIAGGGPNIYLRVEDNKELVLLKGYWGGDKVIKDISYLYNTIVDIYNLDF